MTKITRIPEFLNTLENISVDVADKSNVVIYRKAVNLCCKKEVEYLRKHLTLTSLRSALTDYRNAVRAKFEGRTLPVTYKDRHSGNGHIALKYLTIKKEEVNAFEVQETARKEHYLHGKSRLIICNHSDLVEKADALLDSNSVYDIAAGLLLLTGRRSTEILKTASFEFVDNNHVRFSGQLKNEKCGVMAKDGRDNYVIPVLANSQRIIDALARVRALKPMQDKTEKEVNTLASCALGRAVKRNLTGYIKKSVNQSISNLLDYNFIEPKNLRSMYVHIAQIRFEPLSVLSSFAHDVLGHATKGAVDNYMEYMLHPVL
jgi:hypothetical protein